jgi:uncharacterized protein YfeS
MNHYLITYIGSFYKVKTTGYIKAKSKENAIKNFGIVDEILNVEVLDSDYYKRTMGK